MSPTEDDPLVCEECLGDTFHLLANGSIYCATCDTEGDGTNGLMVGLEVSGDLGPDGPVGRHHARK